MSAAYNYIIALGTATTNLYKIGGCILMIVGTVSCLISLRVFTKKSLRKNPCSIYLIACNICNLLLIYASISLAMLGTGFGINPTSYSMVLCRLRFYTTFVGDVCSPSYLIFAAVDRILVTSRNALTRQRSSPRLSYICIGGITLFWLLFHIHALFFTTIIGAGTSAGICYFQPGLYLTLVSYYSLFFKAICIPILMIILGLWTVKNVRTMGHVTVMGNSSTGAGPVISTARPTHCKDRQLIKILLMDTSVYIFFNSMISILLVLQQITQNQQRDFVQLYFQGFLMSISVFSAYIPFCIGCYTNLLVSKTFRHEVQRILICR